MSDVVAISRHFADGTSEPWSDAAAQFWRAYILDMLGRGYRPTKTVGVILRMADGSSVTVRPRPAPTPHGATP